MTLKEVPEAPPPELNQVPEAATDIPSADLEAHAAQALKALPQLSLDAHAAPGHPATARDAAAVVRDRVAIAHQAGAHFGGAILAAKILLTRKFWTEAQFEAYLTKLGAAWKPSQPR